MNVFVDCGASDGGTIQRFRDLYPAAETFEIHAFEPNPAWPEIRGVNFHREAVWVMDGHAELYCGDPESATLMRGKTTGHIDYSRPVRVATIDFGSWLNQFPVRSVVLKMDIEGACYQVLKRMLQTEALLRIRELHIDWHWNKIGMTLQAHEACLASLRGWGFPIYDLSRARPKFLEAYP